MTYQHSLRCVLPTLGDLLPPWIATRGWLPLVRCCGSQRSAVFPTLRCLFVLLLLCSQCSACAPGRGQYKRRAPRKLTPLVYKQYVPNVSEQTLGASGLAEGPVARQDERFGDLVPNYSEDVLFRDDEGTGADRLLTQRGKEKLDTLAVSVMNQWPGVRLRVVEAWDEAKHHGHQSLHYEGRAVDITTSDRDRSKYGMLARLAVEAGFDWVFYESRSHVHCSVKSESLSRHRHGGCFSADSEVRLADGSSKQMRDLQLGDRVSTVSESGERVNSTVLLWLDRDPEERRLFFTLKTASGLTLSLTAGHLIYVLDAETAESGSYDLSSARATFARRAIVGDYLLRVDASGLVADRLTAVEVHHMRGVYAPLTEHGTLVAGGVVASCYAQVQSHRLAHWAMLPARISANFGYTLSHLASQIGIRSRARNDKLKPQPSAGVHWYANLLYWLADWILPREWMLN